MGGELLLGVLVTRTASLSCPRLHSLAQDGRESQRPQAQRMHVGGAQRLATSLHILPFRYTASILILEELQSHLPHWILSNDTPTWSLSFSISLIHYFSFPLTLLCAFLH